MCLTIPGLLVTIGLVALCGAEQVFIPTIGALYWRRSTTAGAIAGLAVGVGLLICFTFGFVTPPGIFALGGGGNLLSLICNLVVFVVVSLLTKPRDAAVLDKVQAQFDDFYDEKDFE